jgi:protein-L-isoaspartate(D-aspartate) O-methyltransferase
MYDEDPYRTARDAMLLQLRQRDIRSGRVLAAMASVPRERFVPAELCAMAYADRALPIACEQTISQPYIVALMSEALDLSGGEHVLEIGTGSGYQTAILAELAGSVVTVERHAELSRNAQLLLDELGYKNVTFHVGDGTQGRAEHAPYDRILVAAAAARVPPALERQLAEGGTLVIPLGTSEGQVLQAHRKIDGQLRAEPLSGCRFVPLIGAMPS